MPPRRLLLAAAVVAGCQGTARDAPPPPARHDAAVAPRDPRASDPAHDPAREPTDPPTREATPAKPEEPEVPDDKEAAGKLEQELGAIPAWQAVVDRTLYLKRRDQRAVIEGVLGPVIFDKPAPAGAAPATAKPLDAGVVDGRALDGGPRVDGGAIDGPTVGPVADAGPPVDAGPTPTPYRWLVDDHEGNGALAIRIMLGALPVTAKDGERIAVRGAWELDDQRRWFWRVDHVSSLGPALVSKLKDPQLPPGHDVTSGPQPAGARMISLAKDNDAVYFQVVGGQPAVDGDGWKVADELGNPPVALLNLPGERATYGGQDMRAADERWTLRRGVTYWVRIGAIHRHGPDKPATINARTAPIRVN